MAGVPVQATTAGSCKESLPKHSPWAAPSLMWEGRLWISACYTPRVKWRLLQIKKGQLTAGHCNLCRLYLSIKDAGSCSVLCPCSNKSVLGLGITSGSS